MVRPAPLGAFVTTIARVDDIDSPFATGHSVWDGNWHHIVGTFDRRIVRLYVDGAQQGTGAPAPTASSIKYQLSVHNNFYIGMYYLRDPRLPTLGFVGDIADVRIWGGVLSPDEVARRYNDLPLL